MARPCAGRWPAASAPCIVLELPDGEAHKDWQTLNLIFDALLSHGSDRKTVLFALGGGVVGDMTGFAAASYMRGVPFVQVPTTLAGAGRFVRGRQDRHQPSARQEHDRRVLPAAARAVRPRDAGHAAAARAQRRAGRSHQVRPDLRHGLLRLDRGEHRRAGGARPGRAGACGQAQLRDQGRGRRRRTSARPACGRSSISATPSATRSNRAWATASGCTAKRSDAAWSWLRICRNAWAASTPPSFSG